MTRPTFLIMDRDLYKRRDVDGTVKVFPTDELTMASYGLSYVVNTIRNYIHDIKNNFISDREKHHLQRAMNNRQNSED